ncbi:MAG: hypothetical protein DRI46_10470 [Chloroflexi bacterium]|nr:MAG: hypothetical protein DRI46_10470 [Chloroflexota bacterium]
MITGESTLGIDPGQRGGVTLIADCGIVFSWVMPVVGKEIDIRALNGITCKRIDRIIIEHSQAVPPRPGYKGMSSVAAFSFGKNFGKLLGWIETSGYPYELVKPRVWQKVMFAGTAAKEKTKVRAAQAATRIWPEFDFLASDRCRVPHDGKVDSALIAEYGRRSK